MVTLLGFRPQTQKFENLLVQHNKQHHRKVLLSSFYILYILYFMYLYCNNYIYLVNFYFLIITVLGGVSLGGLPCMGSPTLL